MEDSRRRGRRMFLLLAALFLLPVVLAFALYYGNVWRPSGSSSKGELITPARPLITAGLRLPDGTIAAADALLGKWSIVYVGDGPDMAERYLIGHMEEKTGDLDVVSPSSPLGSALLGSRPGDTVEFEAPNGKLRVEVIEVEAS